MIIGIGGKLSGGKTITAVRFAYQKAKEGYKVIANIKLNFDIGITETVTNEEFIDFLKENYHEPEKIKKKFYKSVILLDEISQLITSRASSSHLNTFITSFLMMVGKLNAHVVYTYQIKDSHVDKQLREISEIFVTSFRVNKYNQPLIHKERKIKDKIYIISIMELDFGLAGIFHKIDKFNPEPYYTMYDTEEIVLLDRAKYLRGGIKDLRRF